MTAQRLVNNPVLIVKIINLLMAVSDLCIPVRERLSKITSAMAMAKSDTKENTFMSREMPKMAGRRSNVFNGKLLIILSWKDGRMNDETTNPSTT